MSKSKSCAMAGAMALAVTLVTPAVQADPLAYRYVALDQVALPAPYASFSPSAVVEGRVFGTVFDSAFSIENVAVYDHGTITVGPPGSASVANAAGIVGGANPSAQAAVFQGDTTTLVPPQPGELFASVVSLGDNGLALVSSTNTSFLSTFAYFRAGTETVIDFGLSDPAANAFMNNSGLIGLTKDENRTDRFLHGYRFDPRTATSTQLPSFAGDPTDLNVLIEGINASGTVLGYSFTDFFSSAYHERVGVWDSTGVFQPFFFETINTNLLVFNDRAEIVISESSDGLSYLVPSPGTRLDLGSLVVNLPDGLEPAIVVSIDNAGDITGFAADATFSNFFPFLLVPLGTGQLNPGPVHVGSPVPWAVAHASDKARVHK